MGNANAQRPDDLPPSQGGKYAGFGSTPEPSTGSHPSYATSSHSVPTLDDLQRNPLGALSKGWGLFSSAVASAGKEINQSVLQPGMTRAQQIAQEGANNEEWKKYLDSVSTSAKSAAGWAGQRANEGWDQLNTVAKDRGGVDLNERLKGLGINGGARNSPGYNQVNDAEEGREDFFDSWDAQPSSAASAAATSKPAAKAPAKAKSDWDDDADWKDF